MTTHNDPQGGAQQGPEEGATEAARVLHGDKARAERYPQPDATIDLDSHTIVAEPGRDKTQAINDDGESTAKR